MRIETHKMVDNEDMEFYVERPEGATMKKLVDEPKPTLTRKNSNDSF
jgi:hypothetical protein